MISTKKVIYKIIEKLGELKAAESDVEDDVDAIENTLSTIGTLYNSSAITIITNTNIDNPTNGASVTLPAGTYIVRGEWHFGTRTTSGTTNSQVALRNGENGTVYAQTRVFAAGENWNSLQTSIIAVLAEETTIYLCGSSSRPTPNVASPTNWISAVRIK